MSDLFSSAYKSTFGSDLSGDTVADRMNRYQLFQLMYDKQKMENERYGQMTPLELDKTGLEAAQARTQNTPDMLEVFRKEKVGKSQEQQAKGEKAMRTLEGDITATNQKNSAETLTSQVNMLVTGLDRALSTGDFSGLPPEFRNLDPVALNSIRDNLKTSLGDTPTVRGQQAVENTKGENQFIIHDNDKQEDFKRAVEVALINERAKKKDEKDNEHKYDQTLLKTSPESRIGRIAGALQSGIHPATGKALSEAQLAEYKAMYDQDARSLDAKFGTSWRQQLNLNEFGMKTAPAPSVRPAEGSSGGSDPVKTAVEKHGYMYQPNLYEYRILPDGTVQRKKK